MSSMPIRHPLMRYCLLTIIMITATLHADCLEKADNLAVGICYEEEGNTNLAQAAYERALFENEDDTQARLRLAALYKTIHMSPQSTALLTQIDERKLTPKQRSSLALLRKKSDTSLSSFRARAVLSIGYDDNININPIDNTNLTTTDEQIGTAFSRATLEGSYLHDLNEPGGWFLRGDGSFYYQNSFSDHEYDVTYGRLYAGGGYRNENFSLYLPLYYDRLNYLDRDLFQESGIRPDINIQLTSTLILDLNGMYSSRRYIQEADKARDDEIMGAGAGLFWIDTHDLAYIKMRYVDYSAVSEAAPDFTDKTLYYIALGGIYEIIPALDLHTDYQFRYGDFEEIAQGTREDKNHDLKLALEYRLSTDFRVRGQYRYLYNDSNVNPARYQKSETLLGLIYTY